MDLILLNNLSFDFSVHCRCCPVNCQVSSWGSWGKCDASCEKQGTQRRTRSVTIQSSCNGQTCPSLTDTKTCTGGCCVRDCTFTTWNAWSKCTGPQGWFMK